MGDFFVDYFDALLALFLEMAPWLMLGFLFAGIIKVSLPPEWMKRNFGKPGISSIIKTTLAGIPLPLCSCGVLPTAISLHKNGASASSTNAFLISTPQTGVDSMLATYALMGWPFAIIRPLVALLSGWLGGWITLVAGEKVESNTAIGEKINYTCLPFRQKIKKAMHYGFIEMVEDITKWLVIGIALAAIISVLVPDNFFTEYTGNYMALEFAAVLLISIPLYVCATGSIPIALVLLMKGLSPGGALLLLMAGPATNVASMVLISKELGKRNMLLYVFSITISAIFFGFLINLIIPSNLFMNALPIDVNEGMSMHSSWINIISAILLAGLLLIAIYNRYLNPLIIKNKMKSKERIQLEVKGMSCNHCVGNVEKHLIELEGIQEVRADFKKDLVEIVGTPNLEKVKSIINQLGYEIK